MRIPRIYLETSVFNFVFADDAPEKRADTLKLFWEIKQGKHQAFTSSYVIAELEAARQPKRDKMKDLIAEYDIRILPENPDTERLANAYIAAGIIPSKYATDSLHIALASVTGLDAVVSWNFKHIVKMKTIRMAEIVNLQEGYKRILINSPTEVIEND